MEILVAVSVLGVLLALLAQGVQFGLQATRLQAEFKRRHDDLEAIDRTLRRLVALADPGTYPEPATLRGDVGRLSWTTEMPLHGDGSAQRADVALLAEDGRLLLRWTPRRHVEPFGAAPPWQQTVMLDGVEQVELAYRARGPAAPWVAAWTAGRLPALIRIRLVFAGAARRSWPPIVAATFREASEE